MSHPKPQSLSGIRNTCVFLAMVLHWNVRALRDFHNGLREACIHTASSSPESQHESPSDKLLALEDLLAQSTDSTLAMCRAQVPMFKVSKSITKRPDGSGAAGYRTTTKYTCIGSKL